MPNTEVVILLPRDYELARLDEVIRPKQQNHIYTYINKLKKHVRKQHFGSQATNQLTLCPYSRHFRTRAHFGQSLV